jgi:Hexapeptide repeat of succinyl-transferase
LPWHLQGFLLRHDRIYRGARAQAFRRWLTTVSFEHPTEQIVLQDYIHAVEDAQTRRDRLKRQIEEAPEPVDGACLRRTPSDARSRPGGGGYGGSGGGNFRRFANAIRGCAPGPCSKRRCMSAILSRSKQPASEKARRPITYSISGDAEVGVRTNLGAGAIICNYEDLNEHRTTIGDCVFIGSNTALVAPVTIGDGAYVAAGSVITRHVQPDALSIARTQQVDKPGRAAEIRARLRRKV